MEFGKQLKNQRQNLGLTQQEVADQLYITRQTVSNWEVGKSYPDMAMLVKVCDVYQISIDSLLRGDKKLMRRIDQGRAAKSYHYTNGLTTVLFGLFNLYTTAVTESNFAKVISTIISFLMVAFTVTQFRNVPFFDGEGDDAKGGLSTLLLFRGLDLLVLVITVALILGIAVITVFNQTLGRNLMGIVFLISGLIEIYVAWRN